MWFIAFEASRTNHAEELCKLPREKCMVLARGLSKLYLDDLTTSGDTCGR